MEQFVNFIIRPPRAEYNPKNDLLEKEFRLKRKWFQRKDLEVVNSRGDVLQCSHYMPIVRPEGKHLPCVIYCHGNSGCRADASEAAIILLPLNITVFTLDFSGSGLSGGEHVSLGWHEKNDLRAVVDYLRADGNVSMIGLWGRSMGAVTSLMYGAEDPSIAGMVLDSPFSDLVDLMMELVDTYKIRLPKFTVKFAIQYMRRAIQRKAKFDIADLNAIKVAKSSFVPVLFGHAVDDDFIQPHHSDRIFDAYVGDKNIIKFEGDHNSPRPQFYFDSISIFFNNVLQPPEDEVGETFCDTSHDYVGKGSWSTVDKMGYADNILAASTGPATSSTEDAIKKLRSKRSISRMEVPSDISSKDQQSEPQEEGTGTEPMPSSSKMISFELSDDPIDDDEYVEYSLDNTAYVPSNAEEEERMFMEAVIESLKDMETRHPPSDESQSTVGTDPLDPSRKDDSGDSSSTDQRLSQSTVGADTPEPLNKDDSGGSSSTNQCSHLNMDSIPNVAVNGHDLTSEHLFIDFGISSTEPPSNAAASVKESVSAGAPVHCDTSVDNQSSSVTDIDDQTKATVTVVRNPTGNIMDSFIRRWDLKFFSK